MAMKSAVGTIMFHGAAFSSSGPIPELGSGGAITGAGVGMIAGVGTGTGMGVGAGTGTGTGVIAGVGTGTGMGVGAGTGAGVGVGTGAGAGAGAGVGTGAGAGTGTGAGAGDAHVDAVIASVSVVTVPPNARALPVQVVLAPTVMPEGSITVPVNVVLAASVVAWVGVQNTSQDDAPPAKVTTAPAVEVSAPAGLKIYVPLPLRVSGPPTFIAPVLQYTPGAYTPIAPCVVSVERLIAPGANVKVHGWEARVDKALP